MSDTTSKNERAEAILGRRLSKEDEERGVVPFDCPCELGYWCPVCRIEWDETLAWSEYASMLWCSKCDFDYPSALCIRIDAEPEPGHPWVKKGREAAVSIFLDTVECAIHRKRPDDESEKLAKALRDMTADRDSWRQTAGTIQEQMRANFRAASPAPPSEPDHA